MRAGRLSGFLLFVVYHLTPTDTTPIATVNVNNFEDVWDFNTEPHSAPLIGESTQNHILPPPTKVTIPEKPFVETKVSQERIAKKLGDAVRARVSCPLCRLGVGLLQREVKKNSTFEDIRDTFVGLCVSFKVESEVVCTGIFNVFAPDLLPALKAVLIGPAEICCLILGETCGEVANPLHDWEITFPDVPKPQVEEPDPPKEGLPTFKVLQISDTHFDPDYVEGSVANCEEPLCCRAISTPPVDREVQLAGKWGSYEKCDSPKILIDNMLRSIAEDHPDIDYIIWTGDLPPHDVWNQTKDGNLDVIRATVEQMVEVFPKTPIFPAVGNHESIPAGSFAPPWVQDANHSTSWLYTQMAEHWQKWLPDSAGNTVLHGGFYSVLLRPGFRIISLNMNYCHSLSWWLVVNSTDPAKELQWLVHELQQAENRGEKVHIIGHIPPGSSDCMKVWSRNFNSIIQRYENTIQGQFYGHTHADEFEVLYDLQDDSKEIKRRRKYRRKNKKGLKFAGRAVGVAYVAPSVTTFENHNPAYRIYYVDGDHENTTREIVDHETWTMDLAEANKSGQEPKWYRLYSAKNAYQMETLRPKDWSKLIDQFVESPELFELFYKYYYRDSPTRPTCDTKCKLQILCDLRSGRSNERHKLCHDLELIFN